MKQKTFFSKTSRLSLLLMVVCAFLMQASSAVACNAPTYITDDLTSNRFYGMAPDSMQVVLFYDGSAPSNVELRVQYIDNTNTTCWFTISNLDVFSTEINTREYHLNGAQLTGNFEVLAAVGNGAIDGLAFGLYWKDSSNSYHMVKSNQTGGTTNADIVGMWPIAMSDATFTARTPQITDGNARWQARMTIDGATLLGNGFYNFAIF